MERAVYQRLDALERDHWWFAARRDIIAEMINRFAPRKPQRTLLEAGCGTGGNLNMLARFGDLQAFELDAEARDIAKSKLPIDVQPGMLPNGIPFSPGQFDVVGAFDVLEHVEHDVASMAKLGEQLSPEGKLFITVPANPWLWSKHDETHHHFRRYTKATLTEALSMAGLEPVRVGYFNTLLFPLIVALRLLRKALRLAETPDDEMPSPVQNSILKTIFGLERFLVGKVPMPFGVSLYAVARKRS
jgi:SAM-dependent methyltransferase